MTLNGDFGQNILTKIKDGHLKPKPRWQFLLKDYSIWSFSIILVSVGGLSFSLVIYLVKNNDWDAYMDLYGSLSRFLLLTLPYLWIVLLVLFFFSAQYYLKHTKTGYRYSAVAIAAVTIPASLLFGVMIYASGFTEIFHEALVEQVPYYGRLGLHPIGRWQNPSSGMLAGEIISFDQSDIFQVNDIRGVLWMVSGKNTASVNIPLYQVGIHVRMIGRQGDGNYFYADKILMSKPPIELFFRNMNSKAGKCRNAPDNFPACSQVK